MKTFARLRAARTTRRDDSDLGFVLLDVLIGIAVLALILLTAITSIGPMRQRSYQSSTVSDARQVGTAIGAALADHTDLEAAGLPASEGELDAAALERLGVNLTRGVRVVKYVPLGGDDFQVCTIHETGSTIDAYALFDSSAGRVTGTGRGNGAGSCAPSGGSAAPPAPATPPVTVNGIKCPQVQWVSYSKANPNSMVMAQLVAPEPTVYRFDFPTPGATNSSITLLGSNSGWAGMFFNTATGINLSVTGVATGHDGQTRSDCPVTYTQPPA